MILKSSLSILAVVVPSPPGGKPAYRMLLIDDSERAWHEARYW